MRILFMGTPQIAADCLQALIADGQQVIGVFTRADKPVGRKQVLTAPPVKDVAIDNGIPVFQPATLRDGRSNGLAAQLQPDLIAVTAYGRILPPEFLAIPKFGCINLHVSLLPRYRGSAPIQHAVLNGDRETGVTVIRMNEGIDTGDILETERFAIRDSDTSADVFEQAAKVGSALLVRTVRDLEAGSVRPVPQDERLATSAPMLTREMALFDFTADAGELYNRIRGLYPWPIACFSARGRRIKVLHAKKTDGSGLPGQVLSVKPLTVACRTGALILETVTPEGSRAMTGQEWAAGQRFRPGDLIPAGMEGSLADTGIPR